MHLIAYIKYVTCFVSTLLTCASDTINEALYTFVKSYNMHKLSLSISRGQWQKQRGCWLWVREKLLFGPAGYSLIAMSGKVSCIHLLQ